MAITIDDFKDIDEDFIFGSMKKYLKYNYNRATIDGYVLELGVYKGASINHLGELLPEKTIHGFDSFEGLPDEWVMSDDNTVDAGTFKTKELPKVKKNVELHVGWFDTTLPEWLGENPGNVAMVHLDCDIYSSTSVALEFLNSVIKPGTVIIFDDLYAWQDEDDYPFWRRGQWKALKEWEKDMGREFEVISRMRRRNSGAILVTK